MVMANAQGNEIELLELKPRMLPDSELAALRARWPGRGLDRVGIVGVSVCGAVLVAFENPPEPHVVQAISAACTTYFNTGRRSWSTVAEKPSGDEVAWLNALYSLEDPRSN
jgi:hypothetical protein